MNNLIILHLFSTFFLTGLIWIVQILIYPQYQFYNDNDFKVIHQNHLKKITFIVGPMMLLELLTAISLYVIYLNNISLLNLISVVALWLWTVFFNIPSHHSLSSVNKKTQKKLVLLNWPRTLLWSIRSVSLVYFLQFIIPVITPVITIGDKL